MKPLAIASLLLLAAPAAATDYAEDRASTRDTPWGVELQVGFGTHVLNKDPFVLRLNDFFFQDVPPFVARLGISRELTDLFTVLVDFEYLETRRFYDEPSNSGPNSFGWSTYGVGAHFRINFLRSDWLSPYAQLGGGFAWSPITMRVEGVESALVDTAPFFSIAAGIQVTIYEHLGFFLQATHEKAEVVRTIDTMGGTMAPHDSGGLSGSFGLRAAF